MKLRAATYSRVSTAAQVEHGTSLADQKRRTKASVVGRGWTWAGHWSDAGESGAKTDRPGLNALLAEVEAGRVDVIVATKIDRVSRSAVGFLNLVERLRKTGCHLVLMDEGIDTSTSAGELVASLLATVASFERERIRERSYEARRLAAVEGRFVTSTPPFGYRVVKATSGHGKRLEIDPGAAETIRFMYQRLVVDRMSTRKVTAELNERGMLTANSNPWTYELLAAWARRPVTVRNSSGTWLYQDVKVAMDPILTPSEAGAWLDWQRDTTVAQTPRGPYLLSGYIEAPCGSNAMGRTAGKQTPTYSCRDHYRKKGDPARHDECLNVSVADVDATVKAELRSVLADPDRLLAVVEISADVLTSGSARARLHEQAHALDRELADVVAGLRDAGITRREAVAAAVAPIRDAQAAVEREMMALDRRDAANARLANADSLVDVARAAVDDDDFDAWRDVFRVLGVRVRIEGFGDCPACSGTGYSPASGGSTAPTICPKCLRMRRLPLLAIHYDDMVTYALGLRLREERAG